MSISDAILFSYNSPKPKSMFYIYTNEYLTTPEEERNPLGNAEQAAIIFDGFFSFEYTAEVNIPWQPIEGSSYSSDCVQEMPSYIHLVAVRAPKLRTADGTAESILDEIEFCEQQMQTYMRNTTLLTIIKGYPLFRNYVNYKINKFSFKFDERVNKLVADIVFQEIRTNRGATNGNANVADPQLEPSDDLGQITAVSDLGDDDVSIIDNDMEV